MAHAFSRQFLLLSDSAILYPSEIRDAATNIDYSNSAALVSVRWVILD